MPRVLATARPSYHRAFEDETAGPGGQLTAPDISRCQKLPDGRAPDRAAAVAEELHHRYGEAHFLLHALQSFHVAFPPVPHGEVGPGDDTGSLQVPLEKRYEVPRPQRRQVVVEGDRGDEVDSQLPQQPDALAQARKVLRLEGRIEQLRGVGPEGDDS